MNINNACQQYFKINVPLCSNNETMIYTKKDKHHEQP